MDVDEVAGVDVDSREAGVENLAGANGHALGVFEFDEAVAFNFSGCAYGVCACVGIVDVGACEGAVGALVEGDACGEFFGQVAVVVIEGVSGHDDVLAFGGA